MCNILPDDDVKKYINNSDTDDEDYSIYGLDEEEIEELKKGNQSIYDFNDDTDEDFEDDDYYGEDDI